MGREAIAGGRMACAMQPQLAIVADASFVTAKAAAAGAVPMCRWGQGPCAPISELGAPAGGADSCGLKLKRGGGGAAESPLTDGPPRMLMERGERRACVRAYIHAHIHKCIKADTKTNKTTQMHACLTSPSALHARGACAPGWVG